MTTDKKIISLYNFLKKEGFNDEANFFKSAIIKTSIDDIEAIPTESVGGEEAAAFRENAQYTPDMQHLNAVKRVVWDIPAKYWMGKPQYLEGVSMFAKFVGTFMAMFPVSTPLGIGTIRGSAGIDFAAAASWFAKGEDFLALLNILSGITSVPALALRNVFAVMVGEKVIKIYAFALGTERATHGAAMSARSVVAAIPLVLDFLIGSLESLRDGADPLEGLGAELGRANTARLKEQCDIQIDTLKRQKQRINEIQGERI